MLAVFELLLAWYRFGFLGRSPTPLGSQPVSSCQSFLSIGAVAWFPENSWPKVQNALAPISENNASAKVSWVLALNVFPEGAERKLEVSQFFFVPFQEATRRFRV